MFPGAPTFRTAGGADLWFWIAANTAQPKLVQTQWPTMVRQIQSRVKAILRAAGATKWVVDDRGQCWLGATIDDIPAILHNTTHDVDDLSVDGVWGDTTADAVMWLLCRTGDTTGVQAIAADKNGTSAMSETSLRYLLWVAYFVDPPQVDLTKKPYVPQAIRDAGKGIGLDPATVRPFWSDHPIPAAADLDWQATSAKGAPLPNPPSKGGGTRPWPRSVPVAPQGGGGGMGLFGWIVVAVVGTVLMTSDSKEHGR